MTEFCKVVNNMTSPIESHKIILTLFHTSQCSLCKRFYSNEPFLCPPNQLQSSCASFDRFIEVIGWWSRETEGEKYITRIVDMMHHVIAKGIMAKCRNLKCGALNPNPQKPTCWKCGKSLCCPQHPDLILIYHIEENYWKCPLASHAQKFYEVIESTPTTTTCPKCSIDPLSQTKPALYYDAKLCLLTCERCNRFFTYYKNKLEEVKL